MKTSLGSAVLAVVAVATVGCVREGEGDKRVTTGLCDGTTMNTSNGGASGLLG